MSLILTPEQELAIRGHAERIYPAECCGVFLGQIVGNANYPSLVIPLNNEHEDGPSRRFRILPDDLLRVENLARRRKENVIGFYHSHPNVPAIPSTYDKDHAWETYSYLIVEVTNGVARTFRSWKFDLDAERFNEENILVNQCILEAAIEIKEKI